ncbi:MAG: hypothetical protein KKA65_04295 [Nanoarchaeota archaeon]|nr:hypothetical protein [Nanoarchaeota archaeon]
MCHATIQEDKDYIRMMRESTIQGFKAANEGKNPSSNPYPATIDLFPYRYAWDQGWEYWQDRMIPKAVEEKYLLEQHQPKKIKNIQDKFRFTGKLDQILEKILENIKL